MDDAIERKRLAILRILRRAGGPLSSRDISRALEQSGYDMSDRTIRFHLMDMDRESFTEYVGKRGRRITEKGVEELDRARRIEKVGFLSAKINQMTYAMDFDLERGEGTVVINLSILEREMLPRAIPLMQRVFRAGYAMGELVAFFHEGERIGNTLIPEGHVGIGTVCSITLNGILLRHGIPTDSRFGGLLELQDGDPVRFTEIISYDGTTIDPLEVFIRSGMTDYEGATATGCGLIGASFREIPAGGRDRVLELSRSMAEKGLSGLFRLGHPGRSLLGIPVNEGSVGIIVIGGLNPMAILEEHGIRVHSRALSNLTDYRRLVRYDRLDPLAGDAAVGGPAGRNPLPSR